MLHARVVFGRGWACVWRGAGGRGAGGGADWYALRNEEEASTDAVCSQDCHNDAHPRTFRTLADIDYRDTPPQPPRLPCPACIVPALYCRISSLLAHKRTDKCQT